MSDILDIFMICVCFICAVHSLNAIIKNKTASATHFIVLVLFITCCFPIFCNYAIGYPEYKTIYWYQVFRSSMHDGTISIIYDIYIALTVVVLEFYAVYYDRVLSLIHISGMLLM